LNKKNARELITLILS